jgi:acyl dehydratase
MPQLTEEQTALVGKESPPRPAPYAVNEAMARFWCEMVEDPNPIYFDQEYARSTWLEAPFAPPAMLFTWGMQPVWPEEDRHESMISRLSLSGCTTTLAVNATQEYLLPLRYGDTLTVTNQIASIGEEKTTRLGTGHFVTTLDTFRNQHNEVGGTHSFTLFMYAPTRASDRDTHGQSFSSVRKPPDTANDASDRPERLPAVSLPLTLRRAIQAVAGTRDYYPFHHDEQFARENGAEGIFFNTMFLQAFAGRCATDWFGNDAFLRRLEIAMRASNYVGRTLTTDAAVANVRQEDNRRLVDIEGTFLTEDGPTTGVKWLVELSPPSGHRRSP